MTTLDIDKIEASPGYYQEGNAAAVVALCQEVRRLRYRLTWAEEMIAKVRKWAWRRKAASYGDEVLDILDEVYEDEDEDEPEPIPFG